MCNFIQQINYRCFDVQIRIMQLFELLSVEKETARLSEQLNAGKKEKQKEKKKKERGMVNEH